MALCSDDRIEPEDLQLGVCPDSLAEGDTLAPGGSETCKTTWTV